MKDTTARNADPRTSEEQTAKPNKHKASKKRRTKIEGGIPTYVSREQEDLLIADAFFICKHMGSTPSRSNVSEMLKRILGGRGIRTLRIAEWLKENRSRYAGNKFREQSGNNSGTKREQANVKETLTERQSVDTTEQNGNNLGTASRAGVRKPLSIYPFPKEKYKKEKKYEVAKNGEASNVLPQKPGYVPTPAQQWQFDYYEAQSRALDDAPDIASVNGSTQATEESKQSYENYMRAWDARYLTDHPQPLPAQEEA